MQIENREPKIGGAASEWGGRHSNRGELVAGVADEHAGLPHGAVPDGDALDELGDRARRRRRTHLSPWPTSLLPSSPAGRTSSSSQTSTTWLLHCASQLGMPAAAVPA